MFWNYGKITTTMHFHPIAFLSLPCNLSVVFLFFYRKQTMTTVKNTPFPVQFSCTDIRKEYYYKTNTYPSLRSESKIFEFHQKKKILNLEKLVNTYLPNTRLCRLRMTRRKGSFWKWAGKKPRHTDCVPTRVFRLLEELYWFHLRKRFDPNLNLF